AGDGLLPAAPQAGGDRLPEALPAARSGAALGEIAARRMGATLKRPPRPPGKGRPGRPPGGKGFGRGRPGHPGRPGGARRSGDRDARPGWVRKERREPAPMPPRPAPEGGARLRNLKITLEYDGSRYRGWQIQSRERTVAGTLTEVLGNLLRERITLFGAGR